MSKIQVGSVVREIDSHPEDNEIYDVLWLDEENGWVLIKDKDEAYPSEPFIDQLANFELIGFEVGKHYREIDHGFDRYDPQILKVVAIEEDDVILMTESRSVVVLTTKDFENYKEVEA